VRPAGPTFWLLDARTGWRTIGSTGDTPPPADDGGIAFDAVHGLRLQADPHGPRALTSPDGSLGRLVLPDFVAADGAARLFTLAPNPPYLRRFDADSGMFLPLPASGEPGSGARDLATPVAIAASGRNLLVADRGNRRVVVFDTPTLSLRAVWEARDGSNHPVPPDHPQVWDPVSVDAGPTGAHVLDAAHGVVYRFSDPIGSPIIIRPAGAGRWRRLVVDARGYLYLHAEGEPRLDIFRPDGEFVRSTVDGGEVADRFDPPLVIADHRRRIHVPAGLLTSCPSVTDTSGDGTWFDTSTGHPAVFADDEWIGPTHFQKKGTWIGGPLDSEIYRCQWHRIQLELNRLPVGSRIRVSTYTDATERQRDDILALPNALWAQVPDLIGPPARPRGREQRTLTGDMAVLSREGRFLWLRLELHSDGYDTPAVASARVHYPRRSHLELLPAVYSADDAARRFLERFLSVFQTQLEPVEHLIRDVAGLFDPDAAPPQMVDALSSWLALPLEGDWDTDQRRNLLRTIAPALRRRGTPHALRGYLRAYLENLTGLPLKDDQFPHLVEGYRERNHIWLTGQDTVGGRAAPWSSGKVARLQLDRYATVGKVRLVSTGDPDRDVFHHYAHRFRVIVPAPWVRTAADERALHRAIEAEKPAHTAYDLALLTPGIRIGHQSTIGLDTVIGATPRTRLACRDDTTRAPSRPPSGRLGIDTVLRGGTARRRDRRVPTPLDSNVTLL